MRHPDRVRPGPGEESVWDYPDLPAVVPSAAVIDVVCDDIAVAHTTRALRLVEKGLPPVYLIPVADVIPGALQPSARRPIFCANKGVMVSFHVAVGDRFERDAAVSFTRPPASCAAMVDHVAFSAHRMDACLVDGERARAQPGGVSGAWITSRVVGPFKTRTGNYAW